MNNIVRYKKGNIHTRKIVIHADTEIGTIVNNRNMMQVKNKKKLLGKLYARKF